MAVPRPDRRPEHRRRPGRVAEALEGGPALLVLDGASPAPDGDRRGGRAARSAAVGVGAGHQPDPPGPGRRAAGPRPAQARCPPTWSGSGSHPWPSATRSWTGSAASTSVASAGVRRQVMVSGEEGIGKSRLVAELAAEIVADDGLVLRGAWDEEAVTDFQAFREAFARHYEGGDRLGLRDRFGDLLPVLDVFVPGGPGEPGERRDQRRRPLPAARRPRQLAGPGGVGAAGAAVARRPAVGRPVVAADAPAPGPLAPGRGAGDRGHLPTRRGHPQRRAGPHPGPAAALAGLRAHRVGRAEPPGVSWP